MERQPISISKNFPLKKLSSLVPERRRSRSSGSINRLDINSISLKPIPKQLDPKKRRHMRLIRLFRLTKDKESLYDQEDHEFDDLMFEIDEIIRSCNFFSVRKTNHPVSLDLKLKLLSPIKRSAPKIPVKKISRISSINTFKSKINESYCDIKEVDEDSEDSSLQEPEDPESIIIDKPSFNLKLPALNMNKNTKSEDQSLVNSRRPSAQSLMPRRSLSTNSICSTGRKLYFTRRSMSSQRGLSPFQIVSNFNRNGPNRQHQLDHFNRPNGFRPNILDRSSETSMSFRLVDDYVNELEKIKTLKKSFDKDSLKSFGSSEPLYTVLPQIRDKPPLRPKPTENWEFPKPKFTKPDNDPINIELRK